MWRMLLYGLSAIAGLAGGFLASLLTPLLTCFCCGPLGGLAGGAAACLVPPHPSRPESSRVGLLGGLSFGAGAFIGSALAAGLGLATGAIQATQQELLRQLGQNVPESQAQAGAIIGVLFVLCLVALFTMAFSAAGGYLGAVLIRLLHREAQSSE